MRIHHTENEVYRIYFRCGLPKFHFHHSYSSVSGYRAAVKRLKECYDRNVRDMGYSTPLDIKVIWAPYPFCEESDTRVILQEAYNG